MNPARSDADDPESSLDETNASPLPDGNVSDQNLVALCRDGDAEAWRMLVERYQRLVFSVGMRNGLSREDAADVTQTTFVALLDSIDRIRSNDSLSSWLMTVARRQAWRVRQRDTQPAVPLEADAGVEDAVSHWEQLAWLHAGLQQLGQPCRELLRLLYFDPAEPSYAQIAAQLGRAVGSLGSMRARCLARLQSILRLEEVVE
jgi:RNA polymerase sigma factor (sigma-70 family)